MKALRLLAVTLGLLLGSVAVSGQESNSPELDPIVQPMWTISNGSWVPFGPNSYGAGRSMIGYGDLPWENDTRAYAETKLLNSGLGYRICAQVSSYIVGGANAGSTGAICITTASADIPVRAETGSYNPGCNQKTHVATGRHTISSGGQTWSISTSRSIALDNPFC